MTVRFTIKYNVPPNPYFKKMNMLKGTVKYMVPDKEKEIEIIIDEECSSLGYEIKDFIVQKNLFEIRFESIDGIIGINLYDLKNIYFKDYYVEFNFDDFDKRFVKLFYSRIVNVQGFGENNNLYEFNRWMK